MQTQIAPLIHGDVNKFLKNITLVYQAKRYASGPVHVQFPHIMNENIQSFKDTLNSLNIPTKIFFAHKPTSVNAFAQHAKKSGIAIEVASRQEFLSALAAGFYGNDILVTGIKNSHLFILAILHGAVVSIDSIQELTQYIELHKLNNIYTKNKSSILLRIGDPKTTDRVMLARPSRFGITEDDLTRCFHYISDYPAINLLGFHLHYYEPNTETYAGYIDYLLRCTAQAFEAGLTPTMIDIGGGWRTQQLESYNEWVKFVEGIEIGLLEKKDTGTWRDHSYGMKINHKGGVSGREKLQAKFSNQTFKKKIPELLQTPSTVVEGRSLGEAIEDNMLTLAFEPGMSLLDQCGVSLVEILSVKKTANNEILIVIQGSMFQFSYGAFELFTDPLLITKQNDNLKEVACEAYIVGNTCKEEDFIITRKIHFDTTPQHGDILAFINTAHYVSSFVNATPHQHPAGTHIIAHKTENDNYEIYTENTYNIFTI